MVRSDLHHLVTGSGVAVTRIYFERHRKLRGTPSCVVIHIPPSLVVLLNTHLYFHQRVRAVLQVAHHQTTGRKFSRTRTRILFTPPSVSKT